MPKLQQVIITENVIGSGGSHDPVRTVTLFWSIDGDFLGAVDPLAPVYDCKDGRWVLKAWMETKSTDLQSVDLSTF